MAEKPFILQLVVTDDGDGCRAVLSIGGDYPALAWRAAIDAARACLDDMQGEMLERVVSATAKRELRGG